MEWDRLNDWYVLDTKYAKKYCILLRSNNAQNPVYMVK